MSFFGAALVGAAGYEWRHGARTGLGSPTAEPSVLLPRMMISSSPRLTLSTQVHIKEPVNRLLLHCFDQSRTRTGTCPWGFGRRF